MQPKMVVNDQCGDFIGKYLFVYINILIHIHKLINLLRKIPGTIFQGI